MGAGESDVEVKVVHLTMDKKTKEYKLYVVYYTETGDCGFFAAQVYDSHINGWSMVESREGRIIGWELADLLENKPYPIDPCAYNFANGNLLDFNPWRITAGFTVDSDCTQLVNDHVFVLHQEAPPGSTNLMQDGESNSRKYCISEFHLPEKATAWVKLGVNECDPSIYECPWDKFSLLACNGFLLVDIKLYEQEYDHIWLYNLATGAWRNLSDLGKPRYYSLLMCDISWSALP